MDSALEIIRKQEQNYITGTTQISEFVQFSPKENIDKIEAYLNSKHISGDTDSLGREKPFFNIVTANANVWFRATDIDRANIRIKGTKSALHTTALCANAKSKEWMRKSNFGMWLNEWGRILSRYGSAVSKFVEVDGELIATVVPWNRLIVDAIDFYSNPVIEKNYYTPAQLRKNKLYDQKQVEALIESSLKTRQTIGRNNQDSNNAEYIEVYELHGELELELLTGKESDSDKYVQQVHICSYTSNEDGEYNDFCLYSGKEKNPYHIAHLIKEDGRIMGIGAVEHLFEAQWMVNHNEKAIKDQLDFASKLVFQTSDDTYLGKNVGDLDNGTILYHQPNQPLTQLANTSHDTEALMNSKGEWIRNSNEQVSAGDAIKGNTMPSGTAALQVQALQQEAHSLFELMTENKGIALEEIWREFVIPYLKKQLNTKDEIVAVLDDAGVKEIDALYVPNEAKRRFIRMAVQQAIKALKEDDMSQLPPAYNAASQEQDVANELKPLGNNRYFKPDEIDEATWKDIFKDFEWDVEVEVTNEQSDKQANLATLTTVLGNLAQMGDIENARMVLNKILEETGTFSPMELISVNNAPAPVASATPAPMPPTTPATPQTA
jgi:hypothetical protein